MLISSHALQRDGANFSVVSKQSYLRVPQPRLEEHCDYIIIFLILVVIISSEFVIIVHTVVFVVVTRINCFPALMQDQLGNLLVHSTI
jgi:hypothetical protein